MDRTLFYRLQKDLVADSNVGRAELGHHQPETYLAFRYQVVWNHGVPLLGGPAHHRVRSPGIEVVRLVPQATRLTEEEGALSGSRLEGDVVVEDVTGRHVGPAGAVRPVHRGTA